MKYFLNKFNEICLDHRKSSKMHQQLHHCFGRANQYFSSQLVYKVIENCALHCIPVRSN